MDACWLVGSWCIPEPVGVYIAIAYLRVTSQAFQFFCEMSTAEEDDGKDMQKVNFPLAALRRTDDPFTSKVVLHEDVIAAIEWQSARSADEVMHERESGLRD